MNSTVLLQAVDIAIPGYRILRTPGQRGMASVFLAVQEPLDREVVLKVMAPALAANSEFAERFLEEGKLTAKLQHPNVVTIHDIGMHSGIYCLPADFIPRGTLKERITDEGLSVGVAMDGRSDLFSRGVMLFEMAPKSRPAGRLTHSRWRSRTSPGRSRPCRRSTPGCSPRSTA